MSKGTNVRELFPDREKIKRTRRGRLPSRYLNAPSYEEMIKTAFSPVLSDIQNYGRTKVTFWLLQKEQDQKKTFGYLKIVEDSMYPNSIDSYLTLQNIYNDLLRSPNWHDELEELIKIRSTKSTARVKNTAFMDKIRAQFNLEAKVEDGASSPDVIEVPPEAVIVNAPQPVPPPPLPAPDPERGFPWGGAWGGERDPIQRRIIRRAAEDIRQQVDQEIFGVDWAEPDEFI